MTDGTYLEIDGRPALRFERHYPHPVARVWALVTEPDELATWFPARVAYEHLTVDAPVHYSFDGDPTVMTGRVLAADPPVRLGLDWAGDELWFDLSATDDGTHLRFTTILAERDTAARNAAGWDVCLDALGTPAGAPTSTPTADWRARYDAYLAAGVPSGAVVPGLG